MNLFKYATIMLIWYCNDFRGIIYIMTLYLTSIYVNQQGLLA